MIQQKDPPDLQLALLDLLFPYFLFSLEVCTKNHVIQPEETMGFSKKKKCGSN